MAVPLRRQLDPFGIGRAEPHRGVGRTALVERTYSSLTPFYDLVFGPILQAGRRTAIDRMPLYPGARVLEVGIGTGLTAALYPSGCEVVGIDVSAGMLEKARERIRHERLTNVRVTWMDAAHLTFPDESFDIVYAPYTISTVPDPVRVTREMRRVCRPDGRVVLLNHFLSRNRFAAYLERRLTKATERIGFRTNLDLPSLLRAGPLEAESIERVNTPPIWSLVICRKPR
jgi:phosphatidylethanolamine/phosphatidyl-N-methylethanolamine N-methyltransferase